MRFPKEFSNGGSGNRYKLTTSNKGIYIIQWNRGKNKNFAVERNVKPFMDKTISGKGDEAMMEAIKVAYEFATL